MTHHDERRAHREGVRQLRPTPTFRGPSRDALSEHNHDADVGGTSAAGGREWNDDGENHGWERSSRAVRDEGRTGTRCFECHAPGRHHYTIVIDETDTRLEEKPMCEFCLSELLLTEGVEVRTGCMTDG